MGCKLSGHCAPLASCPLSPFPCRATICLVSPVWQVKWKHMLTRRAGMPAASQDKSPLPLSDTLRDLAVLRASDIDLASFLPPEETSGSSTEQAQSGDQGKELRAVERSFEFVKEARAAIRILNRGDVDEQGARIDEAREGLEEIANGLSTK